MPYPNIHYVSILAWNKSDPNSIEMRIEWLRPLLDAKLPLTLFIDDTYTMALKSAAWYSDAIHPGVRCIPWQLIDSEVWRMCLQYSPMEPLKLPDIRNVVKDSEFFLLLMNMKTELVARVAAEVHQPYVAFLDAGISKIFKDVEGSFSRLRNLEIRKDMSGVLVPGCWEPKKMGVDVLSRKICWIYCGGFFLVSRKDAAGFAEYAKAALKEFLEIGRLTWEVNVWVRLQEYSECPKLHWFPADHNDSMISIPDAWQVLESNPPGISIDLPILLG